MKLTVIISDITEFIHLQEPVKHRSVQIQLTEEQEKMLRLRHKDEAISLCFIEPKEARHE